MSIPHKFRPMGAVNAEGGMEALTYPVLASPKLDGVRCVVFGGVAYTKKLELIPNKWVQSALQHLPDGFDGELIVGAATGDDVFNRSQSGIMSIDGRPDFTYHVFDWYGVHPFAERLSQLERWIDTDGSKLPWIKLVQHQSFYSESGLARFEQNAVTAGYEGVMVRSLGGPYKCGKSTAKEGYLLKIKRFEDHEARVVGMLEEMENTNEQEQNALGLAKRSTKKAGKVGKGTLGALECVLITPADDPGHPDHHKTRPITRFKVGSGISDELARTIWADPDTVGKIVKFKCQGFMPGTGKPRFPTFLGFRDERDM